MGVGERGRDSRTCVLSDTSLRSIPPSYKRFDYLGIPPNLEFSLFSVDSQPLYQPWVQCQDVPYFPNRLDA